MRVLVRALVTLAPIATREIVSRLVGDDVAGLRGVVDLVEDLLDLLEGVGALDLERRNTSKERGKRECYYRGLTTMGNSSEPDGGGPLRKLGRTDQSVEPTLERRKVTKGKMKVTEYVQCGQEGPWRRDHS